MGLNWTAVGEPILGDDSSVSITDVRWRLHWPLALFLVCVCVKMLNYDGRDELDLRSPTSQFVHKGKLLGTLYLKAEMSAV